ncbi:glycerophosphodiester phosphodiesterase family protein, partial [Hyphomonas sp.]
MLRFALLGAVLATLAACGDTSREASSGDSPATSASIAAPALRLPAYFDCVRENKGLLIAAHRGGPAPGFPENTLETLQHGFANGINVFEIDVAESRDGVMLLMHDNRLNRTT